MVDANESNANGPVGANLLGWLVDRHAAALELYARQLCDCPQDVVQEALVRLAGLARRPDDLLAWLYCAVRRRALTAARSAKRRKRHEDAAAERCSGWFEPSLAEAIDARAAAAALESLPQEYREVVVARIWGGLTFRQIACAVGGSDSTAHRRYETGLSLLREKMRIPCPENL